MNNSSEVTRNAVLGSAQAGVKASLRSSLMLPRLAIVDPDLLAGAPHAQLAASGLDALAQLVEPYLSARANPLTDALAGVNQNEVQLAVQCDNSRDAETIPSDLSDFNRYGGLYRHVTLVYVPALWIERLHIEPSLANGKGDVKVRVRLRNPAALTDQAEFALEVRDPKGAVVHSARQTLAAWKEAKEIVAFEVSSPALWSPRSPALYTCNLTIKSAHGEQKVSDRFGFRSMEWVERGPFKLNGERLRLFGTHYHEDHAGVGLFSLRGGCIY